MGQDGVTIESAADYGRWCQKTAEERRILPLIERPPFLTARVGVLKFEPELRQAVLSTGCKISNWASDLMSRPAFASAIPKVEENVDFVCASNEELGHPNGCTHSQTYAAGLKLGWKLCLASDGPEIRRHYLNQPMNEWLLVAMESISAIVDYHWVFFVVRDGNGAWLHCCYDRPGDTWNGYVRWVFRRK